VKPLRIGDITVAKLVEKEGPFMEPTRVLPDATPDVFDAHRSWLAPHFHDYAQNMMIFSFHTYVVKTPRHTILVDTCVGNHKDRELESWHQLNTPYLEDLRAGHVAPEDVDYVMCTHLHGDHVGWNTRLDDGRWVPTFPNAKYLFSKGDWAHYENIRPGDHGYASWTDSVLPIMEAGLAELVETDFALDDTVYLSPSPGHTPGHYCVNLNSGGRKAVLSGDLIHHPVQCVRPDWSSNFCADPDASRVTRHAFVDTYAETDVTILAAHFAGPTAGHIVRGEGDGCVFRALE
jgi:glyoxylase-like metal-dependent hydrolase (beta-lactamase superfamily II)